MLRLLALALLLFGCSNEPEWLLLEQLPKSSSFVDLKSIRKDGQVVRATVRTVFAEQTPATDSRKPHSVLIVGLLIDCDTKSWTTLHYETFDREGRIVEKGENSSTPLYPIKNWDYARGPKLFCGKAIAGGESRGTNAGTKAIKVLKVQWHPEDSPAVEETEGRGKGAALPKGRSASFADPAYQERFKDWLTKKGVAYEVVPARGSEYVVWDEAAGDLVQEFSKQLAEPCPRKKRTC
jgi:hypothetical protein